MQVKLNFVNHSLRFRKPYNLQINILKKSPNMSTITQTLSIIQFKLVLFHPPSQQQKNHVNYTVPKLQYHGEYIHLDPSLKLP